MSFPGFIKRLTPSPSCGLFIIAAALGLVLSPGPAQGAHSASRVEKSIESPGSSRRSRIGFKSRKPILEVKKISKSQLEYDLETGTVVETITMPSDEGEMVLEVHYWSVFDYLEQSVEEREKELFSEVSTRYLMGEKDLRAAGGRQGIMPEINLPDFMPKSLASIIGEGTGSLTIHGRSVTEMSGITTFQKPEDASIFRKQSKFPRLKLEQRQQINIEGTIGTKIHVFVDYNSQNQFENRNKIEVKYVGDEDEILQSLELGDVNLSLPPSMLVSANIPRGNFGIQGKTRLGALTTTFIASKEEGESSNKNINIPVSGEAEASDSLPTWDVNYSRNRHFLLVYPDRIDANHIKFLDRAGAPLKDENERPLKVRVFKDDGNQTNNNQGMHQARAGYTYVDPVGNRDKDHPETEFGFFNELEMNKEFILEQCGIAISFHWVDDKEKIGVIFETAGGQKVGSIENDTLHMMQVKNSTMVSTDNYQSSVWPLMMRNVYSFGGGSSINPASFSVEIFTNESPPRYDEGGLTFLEIFGLDNDDDTKVDRIYVDFARGLIFFPSLKPFYKPYDNEEKLYGLVERNYRMYVEDDPSRLNNLEFQKYRLIFHYSRAEGAASRTFDLGAMQIIEDSERITINNRLLRRGVDYTIDYQFGQLSLKQSVEIPPNSEVKVDFEEVPLFATGNTSLFGFHNEYEFDPQRKNYITSTLFYQSIESVDRTFVRLGDEPKTSLLGEFGGKFEFDSDRLTEIINKLPFFESRASSRLNIVGGLAFSSPNPNTRGGVLIEDFETSKIENPRLMMNYQSWRFSSVPKSVSNMELFNPEMAGNMFWFDPYHLSFQRYGFFEEDLYGTIEGRSGQHRVVPVPVLSVVMEPRGATWMERRESWRSMAQVVSETGVLGMDERDFLQIYISCGRDQGKLILDFGQVNEDQVRFDRSSQLVGLHQLQTEDRNFDGRLDHDEDTGLDQVPGADPPPGAAGQVVEGDDGNDDFYRTKENEWPDGRWLNLTEGNNRGQIGSSFDTEDLNNNGALDEQENVFRLILDLETLELVPPPGIFIPEEDRHVIKEEVPFVYDSEGKRIRDVSVHALGEDSWYLLEIPLPKDNTRFEQYYQKINSPSLSKVMHVRLTLHDFEKRDTVNFAAINFVGNRFKKAEEGVVPRLIETFVDTFPSDTLWPGPGLEEPLSPEETPGLMSAVGHHGTVDISSINTIFNNEYYPPPLVSATLNKYNRSGRQEDFTAQESAINVGYWDLQRNYEGWALKAENNQQSYLDYAAMSFYVNGRQGVNDPKPTLFIRIGTDRKNFYEYSTQVDTGWTEITVPFNGFLSLKDSIQGELSLLDIQQSDLNVKRGPFRIKGNPSLTKVAVMAIGVANETSDIPITGNVWVDDVRLTDVIREFGINSRVQIEAQLSDLGRINFSVNARDNKFRNLNESIPRNSTFDYTIGGSLNLERFTPEKWGLRIPVNMRRSYRRNLPRFHPGSEDVTIQLPENKEKNKTETTSSSFSISYSKRKGTSKLSRYIFDNLKGSLSMRNSRTIAPKNMSSNKGVSGRLTYRATLPREAEVGVIPGRVSGFLNKVPLPYFLKTNTLTKGLADMKFRYMPNDFELSVVGDYKRRTRYNPVSSKFQLDSTFTTTNGARVSYRPFVSMQNTYDIQVKRNMLESARGTKILGFNIGEETARRQGVNMQFAPKAVPWLQPNYTYRANYTMDHSPQYVLSFPKGTNYRKFNTNITQTLGIRFMLPQFRQSLVGVRFTDPARKKKKDDGDKKEQSSSAAYKRKGRPQGKGPSGKGIVGKFVFDPINKFIDSFDPVSFQMTKGSKDRWEQMEKTPGFLYQIGLNDLDIASRLRRNAKDPTKIDTADFNSMGWNFTRAYQSGMRILQTRLSASYIERGTNNHNLNGYTFNRETGPELTFDYSNIPLPLFMRSYISRMDVASGYTLKKGFRGNSVKISEENPTGLESQTREERWNPKYRVTTDLGSTGKVRTRYQKNSSVKTDELVGQNRRAITESEDESFNLQYSFSAPRGLRLPFLKNLKLKSNVRTSLDVRRRISRNMTEVFDELGNVVDVKINRDVEDISLTPTLSYDFAQVIGNLSASYTSHKDRKTGTTRITINMKVSVQLDF